ncbi:MAG: hypothetical protein LBR23_02275 [Spirochaetaceae bacterium]|jgi:hypothetical protein|nr:hypothetical protein [Spirochaetaceae bacterium]
MNEYEALKERAYRSYRREFGEYAAEPCHNDDRFSVRFVNDKQYVYFGNNAKLLACYRVRTNGRLNRLERVPKEIRGIWAA